MLILSTVRKLQKLIERQAVFRKLSYSEKDREKWNKVLSAEFMSSEDSEDETIVVRPLPWRSGRVAAFLHPLTAARYSRFQLATTGESATATHEMV